MWRLRRLARLGLERTESLFDAAFTPNWNPLYQLGALGWFFYWIVIVSGIYLFIFFDTGITQAYQSVETLTHAQWYAGGIMRSLHRYASDALVIVVVIHIIREYILDRLRGPMWFAWVTGVPILWMIFAAGLSGYWVIWDKLAQYVAIATSEWLDSLPFFGEPIARNFLHQTTLSGRFFTLMVFIHIAVPLFMLLLMWIHIHRHTRPRVNPPKGLAAGTLLALLALSIWQPALSHGPADLNTVPTPVDIDWFYLAVLPLADHVPGIWLWVAVGVGTLGLLLLPWLPPSQRPAVAEVDLDNCNGCARCAADCPFGAVTMGARTDGLPFSHQAVVDPGLCTSCGICTGSCPTATPFRRRSALIAGIQLPWFTVSALRDRCLELTAKLKGPDRVMVLGCEHGVFVDSLIDESTAAIRLPCAGMLPPSFLDFLISRRLVDGIILTGCRMGDCYFRKGIDWTEQRISGHRDPYLRERVPRERILRCWVGIDQGQQLRKAIRAIRTRLRELNLHTSGNGKSADRIESAR